METKAQGTDSDLLSLEVARHVGSGPSFSSQASNLTINIPAHPQDAALRGGAAQCLESWPLSHQSGSELSLLLLCSVTTGKGLSLSEPPCL